MGRPILTFYTLYQVYPQKDAPFGSVVDNYAHSGG